MRKSDKKFSNLERKMFIVILVVFLVLTGIYFSIRAVYSSSMDISTGVSKLIGKNVTIGEKDKLVDSTITPYGFYMYPISRDGKQIGEAVPILAKGVYDSPFSKFFGLPSDAEFLAIFDSKGQFKGVVSIKPKYIFDKEVLSLINTINQKDSVYLMLHVGNAVETKNKGLLLFERSLSNASELIYAKFNGKEELYKIIPPPGENTNDELINFLKNSEMIDANGKAIDFSSLKDSKFVIITLNEHCPSCVGDVTKLVGRFNKVNKFREVILLSSGDSIATKNICEVISKQFNCRLVLDESGKYVGQGKLPGYGVIIMFNENYKLYLLSSIDSLLKDSKVLNKVMRWEDYGYKGPFGKGEAGNLHP